MCARSMTRSERSSMPQSQATAILPAAPSGRGTSLPARAQLGKASNSQVPSGQHTFREASRQQMSATGKLWKGECEDGRKRMSPTRCGTRAIVARTIAWRGSLSCERDDATRERRLCCTTVAKLRNHLAVPSPPFFRAMFKMISIPARFTAHVARQRQDHVQALEIGVGVQPGISLGAGGLQRDRRARRGAAFADAAWPPRPPLPR